MADEKIDGERIEVADTVGLDAADRSAADSDDDGRPRLDSDVAARVRANARRRLFGVPERIGRFAIVEQLGEGGMGVVYTGRDAKLDRQVAIKLLHAGETPQSDSHARLLREAKAMAKLSHPNVVHVYEVGEHDGQVYLAMEFIAGQTLRSYAHEHAGKWRLLVGVYLQAAEGLAAAHAAKIVHRDFKPDNVIVGEDGRVRVLDFGLARTDATHETVGSARAGARLAELTQAGAITGTPAYMAPEQFRAEPATPATDQFAFCVALHEALFGRRPFAGETVGALSASVCAGELTEVDPVPYGVPPPLYDALVVGLERDASRRHSSMGAVAEALKAAAAPSQRKRLAAWIALASVAVLGIFSSGWFALQSRPDAATRPTDRAGPGEERSQTESNALARIVNTADLPEPVPEPLVEDAYGVTIHRLDNGLTVYLAPVRDHARVLASLVVRVGAREQAGRVGVVEMLAEAMRTGTARLGTTNYEAEAPILAEIDELFEATQAPAADVAALYEQISKRSEATWPHIVPWEVDLVAEELGMANQHVAEPDHLELYSYLPPPKLNTWADLLAEQVRKPTFRLAMNAMARAQQSFNGRTLFGGSVRRRRVREVVWADTPYGAFSAGDLSSLRRPSVAELRQLHEQSFVPNNAAVVIVGDFDRHAALAAITDAFGSWVPVEVPEPGEASFAKGPPPRQPVVVDATGTPSVTVAWRLPAAVEVPPLFSTLVRDLVSAEFESRFVLSGRAKDSDSRMELWREGGMLTFSVVPADREDALGDIATDIQGIVETIRLGRFGKEQLEAAKAAREREVADVGGSIEIVANSLSRAFSSGRAWPLVVEGETAAAAATVSDVARVTEAVLAEPPFIIVESDREADRVSVEVLPISEPPAPGDRRSAFGEELRHRTHSPLEPQFLVAGRHYDALLDHDLPLIGGRDPSKRAYWLQLIWPGAALDDPLVCPAVGLAVDYDAELDRSLTRRGTFAATACDAGALLVMQTGLDRTFEEAVELLTEALAGRTEPTEAQRIAYLEDRRHVTRAEVARAGIEAQRWGRNTRLVAASDPEVRAAESSSFRAAFASLRRHRPVVYYSGPRAAAEVQGILVARLGTATAPAEPALRPVALPRGTTRIVVVDTPGGADSFEAELLATLPRTGHSMTVHSIYEFYFARLARERLEQGLAFASAVVVDYPAPHATVEPAQVIHVRLSSAAQCDDAARTIRAMLDLVRAEIPDHARFLRAKRETESWIRSTRFPASVIPERIVGWKQMRAESDPRQKMWGELEQIELAEVVDFARDVARAGLVISVTANRDDIDLGALREFGIVEVVDARTLFPHPIEVATTTE